MDRLNHSLDAEFRKCVTILEHQIFAYIEGYTDSIFYGPICEAVCNRKYGFRYKLIPGDSKKRLLDFHLYLKDKNKLLADSDGVRKAFFFFLDKDVDDLTGRTVESDHIAYTEHYAIENYYFLHGNLIEAVSHSIRLHTSIIEGELSTDNSDWTRAAADNWREWVEFCVLAALSSAEYRHGCRNYGIKCSEMHESAYGALDQSKKVARENELCAKLSVSKDKFERMKAEAYDLVNDLYEAGKHNAIFKGKWYSYFLCEDAERIAKAHEIGVPHKLAKLLESHLAKHLEDNLSCETEWVKRFTTPLERVMEKIKE